MFFRLLRGIYLLCWHPFLLCVIMLSILKLQANKPVLKEETRL